MKISNNLVLTCAIFIFILTALIYYPIVYLGFATMDDDWMLLNDKFIYLESVNLDYLFKLFTSFNSLQYSPINTIYYKLIYMINGYDPYWYHLFGFFLHLINTYLCFELVSIIGHFFKIKDVTFLSLTCCLLWAIHPFNVESVVWISASKVLLFTAFGLSSILLMTLFFVKGKWFYYLLSLLTLVLSCLSKEQGVVIPILIYVIWVVLNFKNQNKFLLRGLVLCIPLFIISIIFGIITIDAQQNAIGYDAPASLYSFSDRFVISFYCLCFYIFNTIIPIDLHYHYEFPMKPGQVLPVVYYVFPFLFLTLCSYVFYRLKSLKERNYYLFWSTFFLVNLILCIQIIPLRRPAMVADRYMYLPSLALIVVSVTIIMNWFQNKNKSFQINSATILLSIVYVVFLVFTSQNLVFQWQNYNL